MFFFRNGVEIFVEKQKKGDNISKLQYICSKTNIAYTNKQWVIVLQKFTTSTTTPSTHEPNPVLNPQTTLYDDKITNNQFVCRVCSWNTSVVVSKNHTFEGKEKLLKRSDI